MLVQRCSTVLDARVGVMAVLAFVLSWPDAGIAAAGSARPPLADLSGTAWQLHEIQSMDDRVTRPAQGRPPTLSFGIDGSVTVQADCNRSTGGLAVFNPPSLQFDQFAATQALCGSDSIGEILLRELGWVRSYVYSDGRRTTDEMRRSLAASMIRSWEINRSLHRTYGGRVIYQQFGPEPLDAYVMFLREAQRDGRFQINDRALETAFWAFFQDEQRHDFYPEAEAVDAFAQPPWEAAGN